jgi:5-oxopent-3-ene-1,2,5-tricarboxylate decarboxylase/2-hydroxyhepta-2,4-diene-1,7-dioate isomerase
MSKRARIAWAGAIHDAIEADGRLELLTPALRGRRVGFDEVVWLPPLTPIDRPRTVLALGLNYADHARELDFRAPEEPLVFVKSEASFIGHQGHTVRPNGVSHMHYECELAVVIGRPGLHVVSCGKQHCHWGIAGANGLAGRCLSLDMRR